MEHPRHVEVQITYLPTEHGGKTQPVKSGYSPQFHIAGNDHVAQHEYPDVDQVNPGETVRAYLWFLRPTLVVGHIAPGAPFLLREGYKVVGYGSVVRIFDLDTSVEAGD